MADEGLVRDIVSMIREGQKANTDALKDLADIIRSHDKQADERIRDLREEIGKQKGNFDLHRQSMLPRLEAMAGVPLLVGMSRKSMLGNITGEQQPDQRLGASVAVALLAAQRGARIIRVHDVKATRQALQVWQALEASE